MKINILQQRMAKVAIILIATARLPVLSKASNVKCGLVIGNCPGGCYDATNSIGTNGERQCISVQAGSYSAPNINVKHDCPPGTYSNTDNASACTKCPAGTHSTNHGATKCDVCQPGTFTTNPGQPMCSECDPSEYSGQGADSFRVVGTNVYCSLSNQFPSFVFSSPMPPNDNDNVNNSDNDYALSPSASPTTMTPPSSSPSNPPSTIPSATPSSTPTEEVGNNIPNKAFEVIKDSVNCDNEDDSFVWHGQCKKCPSGSDRLIFPALFLAVLVTAFLCVRSRCFATIFFIVTEYVQIMFIVGVLVPAPWTWLVDKTWFFSSFVSLDLHAAFPLQCYFGISEHHEHVLVLVLPAILLWIPTIVFRMQGACGRITPTMSTIRIGRFLAWMVVWMYLGYSQLMLHSLEAFTCSALNNDDTVIDWLCLETHETYMDVIIAGLGLVGYLFYGILLPCWIVRALQYTHNTRLVSFSSEQEQKEEDWSMNQHGSKFLFAPFLNWWWPVVLLGRKFVLLLVAYFFKDSPFLMLSFIILVLLLSGVAALAHQPFGKAKSPCKKPYLVRFPVVDITLQGCLVLICMLGAILLTIRDSTQSRITITMSIMTIILPSVVYILLAFCYCICYCDCEMNQNDCQKKCKSIYSHDDDLDKKSRKTRNLDLESNIELFDDIELVIRHNHPTDISMLSGDSDDSNNSAAKSRRSTNNSYKSRTTASKKYSYNKSDKDKKYRLGKTPEEEIEYDPDDESQKSNNEFTSGSLKQRQHWKGDRCIIGSHKPANKISGAGKNQSQHYPVIENQLTCDETEGSWENEFNHNNNNNDDDDDVSGDLTIEDIVEQGKNFCLNQSYEDIELSSHNESNDDGSKVFAMANSNSRSVGADDEEESSESVATAVVHADKYGSSNDDNDDDGDEVALQETEFNDTFNDDDGDDDSEEAEEEEEEIWIDEATGERVDPTDGAWTDIQTGLPVDFNNNQVTELTIRRGESISRVSKKISVVRKESTIVLEPNQRVEPSAWGKRQASAFRPIS